MEVRYWAARDPDVSDGKQVVGSQLAGMKPSKRT